MSRIYERYGSTIVAQASDTITAGNLSGGATTPLDKASSGNADGAVWFDCYVNVTGVPSTAATCEMYIEGSPDGTNYAYNEYALSCAVPTSTGRYHIGALLITPRKFLAKIKAVGYDFTASLEVVPVYPADA